MDKTEIRIEVKTHIGCGTLTETMRTESLEDAIEALEAIGRRREAARIEAERIVLSPEAKAEWEEEMQTVGMGGEPVCEHLPGCGCEIVGFDCGSEGCKALYRGGGQ